MVSGVLSASLISFSLCASEQEPLKDQDGKSAKPIPEKVFYSRRTSGDEIHPIWLPKTYDNIGTEKVPFPDAYHCKNTETSIECDLLNPFQILIARMYPAIQKSDLIIFEPWPATFKPSIVKQNPTVPYSFFEHKLSSIAKELWFMEKANPSALVQDNSSNLEQEIERETRILEKRIAEKEKRFLESNLPKLKKEVEKLNNDATLARSLVDEQCNFLEKFHNLLPKHLRLFSEAHPINYDLEKPSCAVLMARLNFFLRWREYCGRSILDSEARLEKIHQKLSCQDEQR
jgi:hypothetical protein